MDLITLLQQRRSIRKFKDQLVETDKIDKLLQAALLSPSSKSKQPWEFVVVQDKEMMQQLAQSRPHGTQLIANAPLSIVVTANSQKTTAWIEDTSIASILIQLEAQALNLGSCWVQIAGRDKDEKTTAEDYVRNLLGIPAQHRILSIIAIGYPDEKKRAYTDEDLKREKIHHEKF